MALAELRARLATVPDVAVAESPAVQQHVAEAVAYLASGEAEAALRHDPYWPSGVDVDRELPWIAAWYARYQMANGGYNCDETAYLAAVVDGGDGADPRGARAARSERARRSPATASFASAASRGPARPRSSPTITGPNAIRRHPRASRPRAASRAPR